MKKIYTLLLLLALAPLASLFAQDTTWVQTFTFDSLWTREAKFFFPTANQDYRRILMYYDLKCYPSLSGDNQYACGQWDRITFQTVYDHRGKLDSTLENGHLFDVNGAYPDTLDYTHNTQYNLYESYQYYNVITATNSLSTYQVGSGAVQQPHPFNLADSTEHSQFIWTAAELTAAGLTAGPITGIQLQFANSTGTINKLKIKMRPALTDSITSNAFTVDSLTTVFYYQKVITNGGWNNIEFTQPYTWNGVSDILVDFSFENTTQLAANPLLGANTSYPSGMFTAGKYYATSNANNAYGVVDFGPTLNMFSNGTPRTYEVWADPDSVGTLFATGNMSTSYADLSMKVYGNTSWSMSTNGWDDYYSTAPSKNVWKHYAITFANGEITVYQNGQVVSQVPHSLYTVPQGDFLVGGWHTTSTGDYTGAISNLRIWDTALPQSVIKQWFNKDITPAHPYYAHLKADYHMNEGSGNYVHDNSPLNQHPGEFFYNFWWHRVNAEDLYYNAQQIDWRPNIMFERGSYVSYLDSALIVDTIAQAPALLDLYHTPSVSHIVNDTSSISPGIMTGREDIWINPWTYTYLDSVKIDSTAVTLDSVLYNQTTSWYSNTVQYEIGRAITPYGIQLVMGTGKTWVYDVTDYYSILQDTVDLVSGGDLELEDVKFAFIKGNPPAPVNCISQPWGKGTLSSKYALLSANTYITPVTVPLQPNTDELKIRTRLTGHGSHTSNPGGAYPYCCEFWYNNHYLYSNNQQIYTWKIERDCAYNPLYPQGGTWNAAREGWCTGDIVQDVSFNLMPYVANNAINIDYGIDPVPANNPGMGQGSYVLSLQLMEYGTPSANNDAEMYNIIKPTDDFYQSRVNPICNDPQVVLRNSGKNTLTSANIKYMVSGGTVEDYTWTGSLGFLDTALVTLPVSSPDFWVGDNQNKFMAWIAGANNTTDDYAANDTIFSHYNIPDNYDMDKIVVELKTNNDPADYTLTITDFSGNVVSTLTNLTANKLYKDTLTLPIGCYSLLLADANEEGLSYWADPSLGSGYLQLNNTTNLIPLKTFGADFGAQIYYPFTMGFPLKVSNVNIEQNVSVFPNPNNGTFTLQIEGYTGNVNVEVVDVIGQRVMTDVIQGYGSAVAKQYNLQVAKGIYFVKLDNGSGQAIKKIVIE